MGRATRIVSEDIYLVNVRDGMKVVCGSVISLRTQ